jgi:[ribosomal protein S18]-alanine N-acetyltransferase
MTSVREAGGATLCGREIVPATPHDLLEMVEIEESSGLSRWGWDSYHAELSRPEAIMLVARGALPEDCGRRVAGFIAARVNADELHVNNIGVRESARRCGIGNALMRAAFARALRLGARTAILEVRAGNSAAQSLYRRHGFEIVGRRRDYYRDPVEDALVMCAKLGLD